MCTAFFKRDLYRPALDKIRHDRHCCLCLIRRAQGTRGDFARWIAHQDPAERQRLKAGRVPERGPRRSFERFLLPAVPGNGSFLPTGLPIRKHRTKIGQALANNPWTSGCRPCSRWGVNQARIQPERCDEADLGSTTDDAQVNHTLGIIADAFQRDCRQPTPHKLDHLLRSTGHGCVPPLQFAAHSWRGCSDAQEG
jgi:hypothetical protein